MIDAAGASLVGQTLDNYRIDKLLGEGAMGEVYLATHTALGRRVALKTLKPAVAATPTLTERFFAEARAVNIIHHENIVECTDLVSDPAGRSYIVMELLEGQSLGSAIHAAGRLSLHRAARIAAQIADAIGAAHVHGIVHRDLKPENVFLIKRAGSRDYVKVLDFGIARLRPEHGALATQSGIIIGTPAYMSPEQVRGEKVGPAADIYALGVIVFHMLAGRPPFEATSTSMMLIAQLQEIPHRLDAIDPALPPAIAELVARALAKDAAARPADMATFRRELLAAAGLPDVAAEELAASASSSHQAAVALTLPPTLAPQIAASTTAAANGQVAPHAEPRAKRWPLYAGGTIAAAAITIAVIALSSGRDPDPVAVAPVASAPADAAPAVAPPSDAAAVTNEVAAEPVTPTPPAIDAGVPASIAVTDKTAPKPSNAYRMHMQRVAELRRGGAGCDVLLPVYRDALQANPDGLDALLAAGRCLADSRHYTDARGLFRHALRIAPRNEIALSGLAEMFEKLGSREDAIEMWRRYEKIYPSAAKAAIALERLVGGPDLVAQPEAKTPPIPEPAPAEAPPKPASGPTSFPPATFEANRISGSTNVAPDDATKQEIAAAGKTRVITAVKLCVDATGAVMTVTPLKRSGFAAWDAKIEREFAKLRYKPFLVDGKPAPACTAMTLVYTQKTEADDE
jgi:tRNA A-37 threonylcarbamoyl transferase component Bud32/cytochrome c-type biogenesis protein CcmH/NrfG